MLLWFSQGCMSNVLNKRTWTCGGHARLICFWCDTYTVVFYFLRVLPLFFIPICLYIHKVVTLFSGKKVTICIYIYIFIHSFFGSHNPPPIKNISSTNPMVSPHFSRNLLALPMVRPWPSNPCRAGVGTWLKQLRRISHSFWKPRISRRSTDCIGSIYGVFTYIMVKKLATFKGKCKPKISSKGVKFQPQTVCFGDSGAQISDPWRIQVDIPYMEHVGYSQYRLHSSPSVFTQEIQYLRSPCESHFWPGIL